jgi:hypothetical protein
VLLGFVRPYTFTVTPVPAVKGRILPGIGIAAQLPEYTAPVTALSLTYTAPVIVLGPVEKTDVMLSPL